MGVAPTETIKEYAEGAPDDKGGNQNVPPQPPGGEEPAKEGSIEKEEVSE